MCNPRVCVLTFECVHPKNMSIIFDLGKWRMYLNVSEHVHLHLNAVTRL